MEHQTPRKSRLPLLFKRKNKPPLPVAPSQATPSQPAAAAAIPSGVAEDYGDRDRALARYKEAANLLKESIKARQGSWGSFADLPGLTGEPGDFDDAKFRKSIDLALASKEAAIKDRRSWSKCRYTVECIFTALSPFAKNFLTIASNAQSVRSLTLKFWFLINDADTGTQPVRVNLRWTALTYHCISIAFIFHN